MEGHACITSRSAAEAAQESDRIGGSFFTHYLVSALRGARGARLGLVNVASHVVGAQVGLVNISDRIDGAPIGLVNIEKGGIYAPQLWSEGASSVRAGLAFGTRIFYTLASLGFSRPSARLELRALEGLVPRLSRENDGTSVPTFRVQPRFLIDAQL